MIGSCPEAGRPRFFCVTIFEFDMRRVLQQSPFTGNPVSPINPRICRITKNPQDVHQLGRRWARYGVNGTAEIVLQLLAAGKITVADVTRLSQ